MKKIFASFALMLACSIVLAQQTTPPPPGKTQSPNVPAFHILKTDSSGYYTNTDLKKHHATLIMYFSPECDHCKHQTKDLLEEMDKFKNIEIVMASYFSLTEMHEFYKTYQIAKYPNIKMGRDEKYSIPPHYNMHSFPFLALYDKKGDLITTFEGNQKTQTLLDAFNKAND
jgi:thioredoxin-related protein